MPISGYSDAAVQYVSRLLHIRHTDAARKIPAANLDVQRWRCQMAVFAPKMHFYSSVDIATPNIVCFSRLAQRPNPL